MEKIRLADRVRKEKVRVLHRVKDEKNLHTKKKGGRLTGLATCYVGTDF